MYLKNHPSGLLKQEWVRNLRLYAHVAEEKKELRYNQLKLFHTENWFKALVPKRYGGGEWPLTELAAFEEAVGWADGSAGWVFTLCSGAGWFAGFMDEAFTRQLIENEKFCMAGSGEVGGTAELCDDGSYLVSGLWKYATGAPYATYFTANCLILKDGIPVTSASGERLIKPFCFLKEEVEVVNSWNTLGLLASASHSFEVHEKNIPAVRTFEINAAKTPDGALYNYPFLQFAEITLAATISGICIHFMEECLELWEEKKDKSGQKLSQNFMLKNIFKKQMTNLENARENFRITTRMSWDVCKAGKPLSQNQLSQASYNAQYLVATCRKVVNELYPYTGLTGANANSSLNQIWRDFQTASQHALFTKL